MKIYIVGCSFPGINDLKGTLRFATFGAFQTMEAAKNEMERLKNMPSNMIHFANASECNWGIAIDYLN